ncbi:putative Ig domain-containing protein [Desmonostoc muscorum]|uniref:putative Ig domain-containing protein n=1 Tax=Desmonostoc muscorum TaxID=1179 RepID=UPI001F2163C8|nr:putative Ig domain-containing protein [Desmonostoc muscorum]
MSPVFHHNSTAMIGRVVCRDANVNEYQQLVASVGLTNTLVVFDNRVPDIDILYSALQPDAFSYTLTSEDDALLAIAQLLAQTGAKYLAIVAHGEPGTVFIGAQPLNQEALQVQSALLQKWGVEEIALYSCEVAKGDRGWQFVQQLSELTGANIAASSTKLGNLDLGGNWDLDVSTGTITSPLAFTLEAIATYPSILPTGDLDPTFGSGGIVSTRIYGYNDWIYQVKIQADGKIVAGGHTYNGNDHDFALVRYNRDGTIDNTFGNSGKVITDLSGSSTDIANGIALQSDGKILAAGYTLANSNFSNYNFALVRYNSDGTLDNSFGIEGKVITDFNQSSSDNGNAITIQNDGKILVTGYTTGFGFLDFGLARYNADGTLDATFGNNGKTFANFSGYGAYGQAIALQDDGKIFVTGYVSIGDGNDNFALARFNPDGSLDTTFGSSGQIITDFNGKNDSSFSVAIQDDNKILVIGTTSNGTVNEFALSRYNPDGSLDTAFGTNGKVITQVSTPNAYNFDDFAASVTVQSNGKILVAGGAYDSNFGSASNFALVRYNSDGSLDSTFGNGGRVVTNTGYGAGSSVVLQSDGNILVAGGAGREFTLVRYLGDPLPVNRPPIVVTNTNDSGVGSLRGAIDAANSNPGTDTIIFNIATSDPGYNTSTGTYTINLLSALPTITDAIILDGTSQAGFAGSPIIELNGANAGNVMGLVIEADNSTIKGLVINRFEQGFGIFLLGNGNNTIQGNFIGTDVTGTLGLGNAVGIYSLSSNNIIGGITAAARNLISGNNNGGNGSGIFIGNSQENQILGNYIGTDITGTSALGNGYGISIYDASTGNIIGGTVPGARNIISGNQLGVYIQEGGKNQILGNYIGTDVTGTLALGNNNGIRVNDSPNNIIGGLTASERNVISSNVVGVYVINANSTNNQIVGNYIGTDTTGTVALANSDGVDISSAPSNNVRNNVISGNSIGVTIAGSTATGNQIQGNWIGTANDGVSPLGNQFFGVGLQSSASNNTIGGTGTGEGNVIAFNWQGGVYTYNASTGNGILSNLIFSNSGLGIDLGLNGVTRNDLGDGDTGSNQLQNFPVLTSAMSGNGTTVIAGTLNSIPNSIFRIEFFANSRLDSTGYGEGQTYLGFVSTITDGLGNANFSINLATSVSVGHFITATATDADNNTSEFSQGFTVRQPNSTPTDLSLSATSVNENVEANTVIGTLNTIGTDAGNTHTYNLVSGIGSSDNASFSIVNGNQLRLNVSPDYETKPIYSIRVRTTDQEGLNYEEALTISVNNLNEAPTVANSIANQTAIEDVLFNYTIPSNAFADPDGDVLAYTAILADGSVLPNWLTFNPTTRILSGTPDNTDLAPLNIKVTATDPSGVGVSQLFQVAVEPTDDPTVINAPAQQTINEDTSLIFRSAAGNAITLNDADAGNSLLQVSLYVTNYSGSGTPGYLYLGDTSGLSYVSEDSTSFTGTLAAINAALEGLSFYPSSDYNGTANLQVMVSNPVTLSSSSNTISILVNPVNDAPNLHLGIAPTVNEDEPFSFSFFQASDPDERYSGTVPITYSAKLADASDLPDWISFDPNSRTFSGTLTNANVGTLNIEVTASDGEDSSSEVFTLTIASVNDAPIVQNQIPAQFVLEDSLFTFTIPENTFTDADGDTLTYTAIKADGSALPDWLNFDAATRTFSGTPPQDAGMPSITVTASDGQVSTSTTFPISVINVNDAPQLISEIPDQAIAQNNSFSLYFGDYFSDPDSGIIYTAKLEDGSPLPNWLTFMDSSIVGTPGNSDVGTLNIRVTAADNQYEVSNVFTLTITDVNDAPTAVVLSNTITELAENTAIGEGIKVADIAITDDALGTNALSLDGADKDNFEIRGNSLYYTGTSPDFETQSSYAVKVIATDAELNVSVSQSFTLSITDVNEIPVDTTPPDAPAIAPITADNIVNSSEKTAGVSVSGTAEANSIIKVIWGNTSLEATADADGNWSRLFSSNQIPSDGDTIISATATDAAGNISIAGVRSVLIDTIAITPSISPIGGTDNIVSLVAGDAKVTGTAESGSIVTLKSNNTVLGTTTALSNGTWAYTLTSANITAIGQGVNKSISATATDTAVNTSVSSASETFAVDTIAPNAPAISSITDNVGSIIGSIANGASTDDTTPTFVIGLTGTNAVAGNTVRLFNGSTQIAAQVLTSSHITAKSVSITPTALAQGDYSITATITDAAGNQSVGSTARTFTLDTTAPVAPTINQVTTDNIVNNAERNAGVILFGNAEANSTVSVKWGSTTLTTTADENGNWSRVFTTAQIPTTGSTTITATAKDAAGNTSIAGTRTVLIDTIANTPSLSLVSDSGRSTTDKITNSGAVKLTGLESNATWEYSTDNGQNWLNGSRTSFTLTGDGVKAVVVRQTDLAGNTSTSTPNPFTFTLDTTAPAAPTINQVTTDNIVNNAERNAGVILSGSAEANSTVSVKWGNTTLTTTADESGNWSRAFTTAQIPTTGSTTITATAKDAAGNTSIAGSGTVVIDTIANTPTLSLVSDSGRSTTDKITNSGAVKLTGLESGATWEYSTDDGQNWLNGAGTSFTLTGDGVKAVVVRQTDLAGNTSTSTPNPFTFTLDTTAPVAPIINGFNNVSGTLTIIGTAEVGNTVAVFRDSTSLGTAVANSNSTWNFNTTNITSGSFSITARATDVAGNIGSFSAASNVIAGTSANNTLNGTVNNDVIVGYAGNDTLNAGAGDDILLGGDGHDFLLGGDGNDFLVGGAGNDTLTGGNGKEQFVYKAISDGGTIGDTITDFNPSQDQLVLTDLFRSLNYSGSAPISDGYLQFSQVGANALVQIDQDGLAGVATLTTLATLNNVSTGSLMIGSNVLV